MHSVSYLDWEIVPEISVINEITGEMQNYDVVYTPSGITID